MNEWTTHGAPPERAGRTLGQKACIALAALVLAGGAVALLLSCCPMRRPLPVVPVLPPAAPEVGPPPSLVRVRIHRRAEALTASCPGGGTWYGVADAERRLADLGAGPWRLGAAGGRLVLDGALQPEARLELLPNEGTFQVGERTYRGALIATAAEDGKLDLDNALPPEDYLRSVVGSEMYARWPLEALMAQAVAARTFMLYTCATRGYLTTVDMAYKGTSAESSATDLAVRLTEGIILTYQGRILHAYFHSTCGGQTTSVDKAFADEPIPPLSGVPCTYCRQSPYYGWEAELAAARIPHLLDDERVKAVHSIRPEGTAPDGVARYVVLNDEVRMAAGAFRLSVGADLLRSARFTVQRRGGRFIFRGGGYGHGVGLCQWGARGLAEAGRTWRQILAHYYPGASLRQAY